MIFLGKTYDTVIDGIWLVINSKKGFLCTLIYGEKTWVYSLASFKAGVQTQNSIF